MPIILSRDQVRRVDQLAIERYGMSGLVLMENAGRNAAELIELAYGPGGSAMIFCGGGNNGGDGCVIARHLSNCGWDVHVVMVSDTQKLTPDTAANYRIICAMEIDVVTAPDAVSQEDAVASISEDDVVIDALLGTGFRGEVRQSAASLIHALNEAPKCAMVSIDVPSGYDCDAGRASTAAIRADLTVTFVAMKKGFAASGSAGTLGRVEVAEIGVPVGLIDEIVSSQA